MSDTATAQGQQAPAAPAAPAAGEQQAPAAVPTPAELAARQPAPAGASAEQARATTADAQGEQPGPQAPDMTGWPQEAIDAYNRRDTDARRYQREAGDSRIQSKANAAQEAREQLLATLTQALNPQAAEPASVEQVTQQLTAAQQLAATSARETAVVQAAWQAGVDPTRLDFLQWKLSKADGFGALDPASADFRAKITEQVAAQVAADPTLRAAGTVQASGVEQPGGASGASAITPEAWAAMSLAERQNLYHTDKAAYDRLAGNVR